MAGIAALKAHLVKMSYNKQFDSSKHGIVADISPEVLFIVHTGDSAVTTVPIESYTLFPAPQFFCKALLILSSLLMASVDVH